jgi:hypothetical protein
MAEEQALASGKAVANCLFSFLSPHKNLVFHIEDLVLFYNRQKSLLIFAAINVAYLAVYYIFSPSAISFFFLLLGLALLFPIWRGPAQYALNNVLFKGPPAEIPEGSSLQRYTIEEISAFVGLIVYTARLYADKARTAVAGKAIVDICMSLFALMFMFYAGLSFSDGILLWRM